MNPQRAVPTEDDLRGAESLTDAVLERYHATVGEYGPLLDRLTPGACRAVLANILTAAALYPQEVTAQGVLHHLKAHQEIDGE